MRGRTMPRRQVPRVLPPLGQRGVTPSGNSNSSHADRRARSLLPRPHAAGRLARAQRQPSLRRGEDRHHDSRRLDPRQLGEAFADLLPVAGRLDVRFSLAPIGGGGDWQHSLAALGTAANVYVDLSGSGADGGMLEGCVAAVGVERLLWGSDITMDTGWAKLRYLEHLLPAAELDLVRWKNAARIFPPGAFPSD